MIEKVLGSTVRIDCTTHDSTGALVAPSSAFASSDFRVYKDGSATEKATTNGITVTSPFDSIVGKHLIEIDTSNSTGDSGFWSTGSEYRVEINSAKTVASIVQSGVTVGRFRLVSADVLRTLGTNAPADWLNAASISADAGAEIAALVETYIVNEGDATAVMQAIANLIAADWVAGDASPMAIAAAVRTNLATELGRIDTTVSSRLAPTTAGRTLNISAGGAGDAVLDADARVKLDATQPDYVPATAAALATVSTKIGTPAGASVSVDIAAVKTDTDSLLTRVTSGITALISNLTAMITGTGASAKYTTVAMSNVSGGGGSGTESDLMVSTTISTLTSQTVFTLTEGSADNDAYNDQLVVITDASTSTQKWRCIVSDYVGSTKTVTLRAAPGFTVATGDGVAIIAIGSDVSSTQLAGAVSSAVATAGVTTTVTGIPTFLRVGDARTVANGGAISVRLYDADDDSLLFGLGTQLFEDATITFSLRRPGNDGTEGAEEAVIPCTWVASGGDGYVQIAYEGDALDGCDAMDKVKEKDCHRWGIKFQWGEDDPITPVYGNVSVLRKIVSTQ